AVDPHAHHERAHLGLVVVEAPPLEAEDVVLGHLLVRRRHEPRQLVDDVEGEELVLDALDDVVASDVGPGRGAIGPGHQPLPLERNLAAGPQGHQVYRLRALGGRAYPPGEGKRDRTWAGTSRTTRRRSVGRRSFV